MQYKSGGGGGSYGGYGGGGSLPGHMRVCAAQEWWPSGVESSPTTAQRGQ